MAVSIRAAGVHFVCAGSCSIFFRYLPFIFAKRITDPWAAADSIIPTIVVFLINRNLSFEHGQQQFLILVAIFRGLHICGCKKSFSVIYLALTLFMIPFSLVAFLSLSGVTGWSSSVFVQSLIWIWVSWIAAFLFHANPVDNNVRSCYTLK